MSRMNPLHRMHHMHRTRGLTHAGAACPPAMLAVMPGSFRPKRFHQGTAVAVLGLHLLGLALGLRLSAWADRSPALPTQQPLAVRLLRLPQPTTGPATAVPQRHTNPATRAQTPTATRRQANDTLQAITLPAPAGAIGTSASVANTAPQTPSPTPPAAAGPPLNLALPRGASAPWRTARNPALDDPRSNLGPLTLEQKLADALGGDGRWVEQAIDADHRRLKRGDTCIYLQRPQAAQLDPFHPANRALPWQAGQPTRCR